MANGVATAFVSGNITADPELVSERFLKFSIAVNKRAKGDDGEWHDKPHYFDVKVLGNRASGLAGILSKGRGVSIVGDLEHERWEKDGQKRSAVRIIAREVVPHYGESASSGDSEAEQSGSATPDDGVPFAPSVY